MFKKIKEKSRIKDYIDKIFIITVISIFVKELLFLYTLRSKDVASFTFSDGLFVTPDYISALLMVLMFVSVSLLFKNKGRFFSCYMLNLIVSVFMLIDLWYYRANHGFLSLRHIFYPETFNPLGNSLFQPKAIDIFLFIDLIVISILAINKYKKIKIEVKRSVALALVVFIGSGLIVNYRHIKIKETGTSSKQIFRHCWVPFQTMMNASFIGYQGFDIYKYIETSRTKRLSEQDKSNINTWLRNNKEDLPDNEYKGIFKGKNLICIQVESLENFVIGKEINGQEITPNINKLLGESFYFNNIYEQNSAGYSSDCDLMLNTGLLPLKKDPIAFARTQLDVYSLPKLLEDNGYSTISSRTEEAGNWNWAECHKGVYGFDRLIDLDTLERDDLRGINLSDKSYFRQLTDMTKEFKEPYYSMMVTINSHAPYGSIYEYERYLDFSEELNKNYMGKYLQSVRFTDEQIGKFIEELDKSGKLENTVIMIYGDHTSIHSSYEEEIQSAPIEGDWWKKKDNKIPLIIYNKGSNSKIIEASGGQIDFYPTIAYLMGVSREELPDSIQGRILLNTERDAVILDDGTIVGKIKNEEEKNHLNQGSEISKLMIDGNYFPINID